MRHKMMLVDVNTGSDLRDVRRCSIAPMISGLGAVLLTKP